ncbi:MAG: thiamine pyrophosphate-dependent enzyme [Candidatus Nealsonbacteria bacterium]|nr:thiamine pyrophosphate-dependent enzyme [Candidatus Nealsonbacteria bacterium]
MEKILSNQKGEKQLLLGNEAVIRGALESGVSFVSTYPGTPASEIGNIFFRIHKEAGVYFEFSVNEKVAMEAGVGASYSGVKTLVAMKNFGLNVCIDSLMPFVYTGSPAPTVLMIADDASCWSSAQAEVNTRPYSYLAHIPTIEPSDPQECKEFTKFAFELSEKFKIPVLLRLTTRVSHQQQIVTFGEIQKPNPRGTFIKNPHQFVTLPPRVLEMKAELLEKIEKIRDFAEKSKINRIEGNKKSPIGIITSGVSYLYIKEAMEELNLNLPILKLGFFYPLPEKKIKNFLKGFKKILIVEELENFLEREVKAIAKGANPKVKIFGKDLISEVGELRPENVIEALAKVTGKKYSNPVVKTKTPILKRKPQLCPGCPYWLVFSAVKKAVNEKEVIFGGDIGCYMLAGNPPHYLQDYLSCMGSSIGIAHGIKKVSDQKLIAFIGDSTFFHAGLPALINTVFNKSNPLIIIMNNQTTGMTGHQPHPAAPKEGEPLKIEDVVKALGVKNMKIVDQGNQEEMINTIKEFLNKTEVSVIIARRPCVFVAKK